MLALTCVMVPDDDSLARLQGPPAPPFAGQALMQSLSGLDIDTHLAADTVAMAALDEELSTR